MTEAIEVAFSFKDFILGFMLASIIGLAFVTSMLKGTLKAATDAILLMYKED